MEQFNIQQGKCFYTDQELSCKYGEGLKRNSLSTDKIIPEFGYILGNVVFCTNKFNTVKNDLSLEEIEKWMPPIYKKITDFFGAKARIEVGAKVKLSSFTLKRYCLDKGIFIVDRIDSGESYYINDHRSYYENIYVKSIKDLKNPDAPIYGPIAEPDMAYLWQLNFTTDDLLKNQENLTD